MIPNNSLFMIQIDIELDHQEISNKQQVIETIKNQLKLNIID